MSRAGAIAAAAIVLIATVPIPLQAQNGANRNRSHHQSDTTDSHRSPEPAGFGGLLPPQSWQPVIERPTYNLQWNTQPDEKPSGFLWIPWDAWVAIFTAVLAGVSIWQGRIIIRGERLTLAALRSSQRQARAAIRAAKASEDTVEKMEDTAKRQLRAYIGIISSGARVDALDFTASLTVANRGQTPASGVHGTGLARFGMSYDPSWEKDQRSFDTSAYVLPNGEVHYKIVEPLARLAQDVPKASKDRKLYVFGTINYIDAFKENRWLTFRFIIGGDLTSGKGTFSPCDEGNDAN